jgi:hypothetical protein
LPINLPHVGQVFSSSTGRKVSMQSSQSILPVAALHPPQ